MKIVEEGHDATIAALEPSMDSQTERPKPRRTRECWNCGRKHEYHNKELCPAYGKTCHKCGKPNHFASKCRSKENPPAIHGIDENEIFEVSALALDDSQLVTVQLESGSYVRFQVDTGAQCNVVPVALYKQATGDNSLSKVVPVNTKILAS